MRFTRRSLLSSSVAAGPVLAAASGAHAARADARGLVIHSFAVRTAGDRGRPAAQRFSDPGRFLDYARSLGASGVQVALGAREGAEADALRDRASAASMSFEGIVSLPRDQADVERFEAEIRTAARAGAVVVRTVTLSGRRYEMFKTLATFRRFAEASLHSLKLAAGVVAKHGIRLAVENHKDWRADELIALLKQVGNDHVGVCLDTGNSIALLEDPTEVVEALAPWAFTTHLKDMGLEEYREGFLLAEVPLGTGFLDIPRIVRALRTARPEIRLNLEMITRDPLKVPCLTDGYWVTLAELPGRQLARMLTLVRDHVPTRPLPRISSLTRKAQLDAEEDNVRRSLAFAREHLEKGSGAVSGNGS
jgi:sugar phosphate isomerase/epimerase